MDFEYLIIGIIFIVSGVFIIIGYEKLKRKIGNGGLSFKLRNGGFGLVVIGIYLIITESIKM
ncbi:hypothetical protein [Polaribacter gochangensis]|uniref:hypothetical protein n=1 Tax=Polaribacter gochangensis TaxID=3252903 RepID=UPI0039049B74